MWLPAFRLDNLKGQIEDQLHLTSELDGGCRVEVVRRRDQLSVLDLELTLLIYIEKNSFISRWRAPKYGLWAAFQSLKVLQAF